MCVCDDSLICSLYHYLNIVRVSFSMTNMTNYNCEHDHDHHGHHKWFFQVKSPTIWAKFGTSISQLNRMVQVEIVARHSCEVFADFLPSLDLPSSPENIYNIKVLEAPNP